MTNVPDATIVLLALVASGMLGQFIRPVLRERHLSRESIDAVQLVIGMLVTFAALVLGLLTASVKTSFDATDEVHAQPVGANHPAGHRAAGIRS